MGSEYNTVVYRNHTNLHDTALQIHCFVTKHIDLYEKCGLFVLGTNLGNFNYTSKNGHAEYASCPQCRRKLEDKLVAAKTLKLKDSCARKSLLFKDF